MEALLQWITPRQSADATPEVKPQALHDVDLPSGIEGLDTVNGLRRVLGRKPLYISMLRKFVAGQQSAAAEITRALEGDLPTAAEQLAHTLKSVSGSIGATDLQGLAEKLESAIRDSRPREEIDACFDELKIPLACLLDQLAQQLPEERCGTAGAADPAQLKAVCDMLAAMLADDDAEAVDVLEANAGLLNAAYPRHYRLIDDGIQSFNFEAALAALRAATGTST